MSKEERVVHTIKLYKNPIWFKASFIGKYEGIKFRLSYREYLHDETEEVAKAFVFKWPGRVPENKALAEEGIIALFKQSKMDYSGIIDDDTDLDTELYEQDQLNSFIDEQIIEIDEALQKGHEGKD